TNQPGLPTEPDSTQLSAGRTESLAALPVPDSQDAADTLPRGYFVTEMAGQRKLVCFHTSPYSGMTAYQIMDYNKYENRQVTAVTITVVILISVTVSALLTIFLSVRLTRPLEKIQHRMEHIARGDFARDPALEGADEIGQLGRGINDLATSVDDLLRHNISEEREKKALELKLLQNQINPHFIYNALNAIRMMAMIQKSHGIYDTVTALGNLLKETSKGAMEKIPLREEFFLLEQFIHIHNIRKKGLIQAIYALDEDIADGLIVRFLLQPLVENAILHGFEGKKGICRIWVTAKRAGDRIRITVRDDGVGIPPDRLASLFDEHPETEGERFNRVGVKNIQEQIRYVYGEAFVMTVESRLGEGTTVGIEIPVEFAAAQKMDTTEGGVT
ncbi:MAG TPA: histidine kinase, partial [Clostridia bacterium]